MGREHQRGSGFGGAPRGPPLYPLRGCRSTLTLSPVLSIPTVGKSPPGGTPTSLRPTTVPFRVKNTWGAQTGGVTPILGVQRDPTHPPKKTGKEGSKAGKDEPRGEKEGFFWVGGVKGVQTHWGGSGTHSRGTPKSEGRAGRPQSSKKWGQRG